LKATIELQSRTELADVTSIVEQTLAIVAVAVQGFIDGAAYSDIHIHVHVTDEFIHDVECNQRIAAHPYTTERIGGGVAGISQHHDAQEGRHLVLINTSPFASEDFWPRTHLPGVVAHEVAHCLIEHCRAKAGPNGHVKAPQTWDEMIAFTSQLPHALAVAYVLAAGDRDPLPFSAGSFRDVSRVAAINARMWAELFAENREALLKEIAALEAGIGQIREWVRAGDRQALAHMMGDAARIKEERL
jgi:hypothetical protein